MSTGPLKCRKLYGSGLKSILGCDLMCKGCCRTAHLLMTESIHRNRICLQLTYISAVSKLYAFRNCNNHRSSRLRESLYLFHKLIHIKGSFRKIYGIYSLAVRPLCKGSSRGKPSGVPSHDLYYTYGRFFRAERCIVPDNLFKRGCNIFCR